MYPNAYMGYPHIDYCEPHYYHHGHHGHHHHCWSIDALNHHCRDENVISRKNRFQSCRENVTFK
jgi:hypothetical protein